MGRPSINYILTSKGMAYFPKRYNLLSEMVLRELSTELTPEQRTNFMQKLGKKLADQYRAQVEGKTESARRIFLFDLMQKLGFQITMKRDPASDATEIYAHNCIYHDVAQQFHEICMLDQTLIAELMDKKIELQCCMAKGDGMCCFKLNSDKSL